MIKDEIYIVGFYGADEEIKRFISSDFQLNIDRLELEDNEDRPMEFVKLLEQLYTMVETSKNQLIGFGNDTILFKEYRGIVKDLYNVAQNTRDLEMPAIIGVSENSLHGVSAARNSGNSWHLRSHFVWLNSLGVKLLYSSHQEINNIIGGFGISPTSRMISNNYYEPHIRERKARAIECEKFIGELFVKNGIILPHTLSRKIKLKRYLKSLFPYKKV